MDDHTQLGEDVLQPHSVLEVYHTAVCVWEDKGIPVSAFLGYVLDYGGIDSYYMLMV